LVLVRECARPSFAARRHLLPVPVEQADLAPRLDVALDGGVDGQEHGHVLGVLLARAVGEARDEPAVPPDGERAGVHGPADAERPLGFGVAADDELVRPGRRLGGDGRRRRAPAVAVGGARGSSTSHRRVAVAGGGRCGGERARASNKHSSSRLKRTVDASC
jgi:hypothetical protein